MVFYAAFNSISVISRRQLTLFILSWVSPVLGLELLHLALSDNIVVSIIHEISCCKERYNHNYTPAKRMFSRVYWNESVRPYVRVSVYRSVYKILVIFCRELVQFCCYCIEGIWIHLFYTQIVQSAFPYFNAFLHIY